MKPFNLEKNTKIAIDLPNGTGVSHIPTGNDPAIGDGLLLNPGAEGGEMGGEMGGESQKESIKDIVGEILLAHAEGGTPEEISHIAKKAVHADIPPDVASRDDVVTKVVALGRRADEDPGLLSVNPSTGEQEKPLHELASEIAADAGWDIEELMSRPEEGEEWGQPGAEMGMGVPQDPVPPFAQDPLAAVAQKKEKVEEWVEPLRKRRKRGNPFRVLMGKVQKMMDHGMRGQDIIRKILRLPKNSWKRETVSKCVEVVKQYNRKKKGKEKKEGEKLSSFNLDRHTKAHTDAPGPDGPGLMDAALEQEIIEAFGPNTVVYETNDTGELSEQFSGSGRSLEDFLATAMTVEEIYLEKRGAEADGMAPFMQGIADRLSGIGINLAKPDEPFSQWKPVSQSAPPPLSDAMPEDTNFEPESPLGLSEPEDFELERDLQEATRLKNMGSPNPDKWAGKGFNLTRYAQEQPQSQAVEPEPQPEPKGESADSNSVRFKPETLKEKPRKSIYDIPRDPRMMSSTELIVRLGYLLGARDFDPSRRNENGFELMGDKSGARKDVQAVKRELTRRGYSKAEMEMLVKGLRSQQPSK